MATATTTMEARRNRVGYWIIGLVILAALFILASRDNRAVSPTMDRAYDTTAPVTAPPADVPPVQTPPTNE